MRKSLFFLLALQFITSCNKESEMNYEPLNKLKELIGMYCGYISENYYSSSVYPFEIKNTDSADSFVLVILSNSHNINQLSLRYEGDTIICKKDSFSYMFHAPNSQDSCLLTLMTSGKGFIDKNTNELNFILKDESRCYNSQPAIEDRKYILKRDTNYAFKGIYVDLQFFMDTLQVVKSNSTAQYDLKIIHSQILPYKDLIFNTIQEKCCFEIIGSNMSSAIQILNGKADFEVYRHDIHTHDFIGKLNLWIEYRSMTGNDKETKYYVFQYMKIENLP